MIKVTLLILVIVLVVCLAPMLFLWSINSLAELGGADFYIDHTVWSYLVSFVFLAILKVESSK